MLNRLSKICHRKLHYQKQMTRSVIIQRVTEVTISPVQAVLICFPASVETLKRMDMKATTNRKLVWKVLMGCYTSMLLKLRLIQE